MSATNSKQRNRAMWIPVSELVALVGYPEGDR